MERFDTSVRHHAWYEHWHRYYFVKELVKDMTVCDIACGEGYGSSLLASVAKSVTGVDIDASTIELAQKKYCNTPNLKYIQSDALSSSLQNNEFDVVVSFETLEHLKEHDTLLNEFSRILKTDGILMISTPDKNVYSAKDTSHNHFHEKELTASEFDLLISQKFKYIKTFGQKLQLTSVIESQVFDKENSINKNTYIEQGNENYPVNNSNEDIYLIKIGSNNKQALESLDIPAIYHFSDNHNNLFKHYENQIQKSMAIDKQNHQLHDTVERQQAIINHLKSRLGY